MNEEVKQELEDMRSGLSGLSKAMPFNVPDGYFGSLASDIGSLVAPESHQQLDDMRLPTTMLQVPDGYFDQLPNRVMQNVEGKKKQGVVLSFRWLRLAAAAVVIIAVGLGLYRVSNSDSIDMEQNTIASVDSQDISAYLQYASAPYKYNNANEYILDDVDLQSGDIVLYLDETGWEADF